MPELPEVEIVKQSLEKTVKFKKIKKVLIKNRNLRFKIQNNMENLLKKQKIINVFRKSKYLIIQFLNNHYLVIHFGMSGTLHLIKNTKINQKTNLSFYHSEKLPKKHNHIEIIFSNFKIIYNDPRRFGFLILIDNKKDFIKYFEKIGPEPLNNDFSTDYLKKILKLKKTCIKNFLLNQKFVSGIGNIYASEILYYSKINPKKLCKNINSIEINNIVKYSKVVLKKAIKKGGSTIRNFKNSRGSEGSFQNEFKVYNRESKPCLSFNCKENIKRISISNRSTYLCFSCQKINK